MTTDLKHLQVVCDDATRADVVLETLSDGKLSVSVHWPETQGDDGDYCHGQGTIVGEAHKVLAALKSEGWQHCEFGGRKDFGHGGGTTHFAVAETVREFVTWNSESTDGRVVRADSECKKLYVAEVIRDMKVTTIDEEGIKCDERDAFARDVISDLCNPLFCCRSPRRKLPPQTAEQALRRAAERGLEGLRPGMIVRLNGEDLTL